MADKKVLWIDDMLEWAKSAQYILEAKLNGTGNQVHIVHRSNEGEINDSLMNFDFDLVAIDYHMDPQNGDVYVKKIREEEHLELVPIIFYTQDPSVDLDALIQGVKNIETIHRSLLVDGILAKLFKEDL